jgi:hypothetical protein
LGVVGSGGDVTNRIIGAPLVAAVHVGNGGDKHPHSVDRSFWLHKNGNFEQSNCGVHVEEPGHVCEAHRVVAADTEAAEHWNGVSSTVQPKGSLQMLVVSGSVQLHWLNLVLGISQLPQLIEREAPLVDDDDGHWLGPRAVPDVQEGYDICVGHPH